MFVSDEDLMMKCRKGDMSAFELLVRRYQKTLINYIHRSVNDYHRARRPLPRNVLRVFRARAVMNRQRLSKTGFTLSATNLCRNEVRNRSRQNTYLP